MHTISFIRRALTSTSFALVLLFSAQASAAPGSYSLNFEAADPDNYDRKVPSQIACPAVDGRASDPIANAQFGNPHASVNSLEPRQMALGQIVPFVVKVAVNGSTAPENGAIRFTAQWDTKTTSGKNFGFDPAYGIYCAFVDTADSANVGLTAGVKVSSSSFSILNPGTSNETISGTVNIEGLSSGQTAVVEVWVVLKDSVPSDVNGNVQSDLASAATSNGSNISVGNQTIPLAHLADFITQEADIQVQKMDAPDPVARFSTLNYQIEVTNLSGTTVANNVTLSDTIDADLHFVGYSVTDTVGANTVCSHDGSPAGGAFTCNLDFLSPLENVTINITAEVLGSAPLGTGGLGGTTAASCPVSSSLCNVVSVSSLNDATTANNQFYQPSAVTDPGPIGSMLLDKVPNADLVYSGTLVTYTYTLTNPGVGSVINVVVTDDKCSPLSAPSGDNGNSKLDPGEEWTYTCAQPLSVTTTNIATATGEDEITSYALESQNDALVTVIHPDIAIDKTADASEVPAGSLVTYTYTITNPGDDALSNVYVTDDKCSPVGLAAEVPGSGGNGDNLLDPGEQWQATCATTLSESTTNIGTAYGKDSLNGNVSAQDSYIVTVPTATPTSTPTNTPTATPTNTPSPTPTDTPTMTPTSTPTATPTEEPTHTPTYTPTSTPTSTPTEEPTHTPTYTPTSTPTSTPTATCEPTNTPTVTPTNTPTSTPTDVPTVTPTSTPTNTPEPSVTPTVIPTVTPTATATAVPSISPSPTPPGELLCTDIHIENEQFKLDGTALAQQNLTRVVGRDLLKVSKSKSTQKYVKKVTAQAHALYLESWGLTWSIPSINTQCENTQYCVSVSNTGTIQKINDNSQKFVDLVNGLVKKLKASGARKALTKRRSAESAKLHAENLVELAKVPAFKSSCTLPGS